MTVKQGIIAQWAVIVYALICFAGAGVMLEFCSDGELFGRGCSMAENYAEAYGVALLAWAFGILAAIILIALPVIIFFAMKSLIIETVKEFRRD